jgi:hypothetical protein
MLRYLALGLIGLAAGSALAQQAPPPAASSSAAPIQPSKPVIAMEEPLPGDRWTYEVRDEIAGAITATRTNVVTEVTPTEISTRVDTAGKSNPGQITYDRSWNMLTSGPWKYSPNDGAGVQPPLSVGKTWNIESNEVNAGNGTSWKRSGKSKVVGQETLTTRAGTFDTFKIETSYSARNANDPTRQIEVKAQTWYAPAVDHWVKRSFVMRANKRLMTNNTIELVEYGRKQ